VISRWLAELVAPSGCAACDLETSLLFCEGCAATIERATTAEGAFVYGGAIAEAIVRLKYGRRSDLAARLGHAMVEGARRDVDLVVPVPLHSMRAVERGFNQSALLARPLARHLRVSFGARVLERLRDTPRQAALGRSDRFMNVKSAFSCRQPDAVRGRRILVVDDVRTTGATIAECCAVLAKAGAKAIFPYVLAVRDELPEFR
jgi:competence protein ComFC